MIIKEDVATKNCIVVTSSQKHSHRTSLIQLRPIFEFSFRQKSNSLTKQQKQELNARRKSSSLASATSTSTKQLKSSDSNRRRIKRRHTVSGTKDIGKENLAVAIDLSKNLDGHDRRLSLPVWTKKLVPQSMLSFEADSVFHKKRETLSTWNLTTVLTRRLKQIFISVYDNRSNPVIFLQGAMLGPRIPSLLLNMTRWNYQSILLKLKWYKRP